MVTATLAGLVGPSADVADVRTPSVGMVAEAVLDTGLDAVLGLDAPG